MEFFGQALGSAVIPGLNFLSGRRAGRRADATQINRINQGDRLTDIFFNLGQGSFDPSRDFFINVLGNQGGFQGGLDPRQQALFSQLAPQFQSAPSPNQLFQGALGFPDPRNISPFNNEVLQAALQDSMNRGATDATRIGFDRANDLFASSVQGIAPVAQAASNIIQAGGQTPESQQVAQQMLSLISSGGRTAENRGALRRGNTLIDSGGLTAPLRDIQTQLQSLIESGGLTDEGRQLFGELFPLIEAGGRGGALLPFDQALSFARDAATTAGLQQAEAVRRNALQRGGAPGSVVASGLQNQALADFGDALAQNEARALREAAIGQQGLQLQQFLGTQGTLANLLGQAQSIRGQAVGGLGNVANATAANVATGGRLVDSALGNQLGTLQAGIGGFNQNFANEIARLGTGGDIFSSSLGVFNDLQRTAFQGLQGAESQRAANQQNALNALLGLSGQGLDVRGQNIQAAASQGGLQNEILSQLLGLASQGPANQFGAANALNNAALTQFGFIPSLFGSTVGTRGGAPAFFQRA